ncbi:hypothetical protein PIB30_006643 [Stylosanthes scabra]|uniref:Uncharacterized protein n=1 Tax=Stylosanthes scabra TaxID=79078 RepID=A0ABU6Q5I0_9FABA|nr:hypothetical protein [Stylosanthes scabra]
MGEGVNRNAGFVHVEDMELLLHRACGNLLVGSPVFDPSLTQVEDGSVIYEFAVYLPRNERGLELVAHGPQSFDERTARQEASFALLEKVVAVTGLGICDYTYRTLGQRQQINVEVTEGSAGRLLQRVLELEDKNKELEDQLKAFQSMFE